MTNEISKQEWEQFFNETSKNYLEWQTKVEVLKDDIGAQVLSEGLPLVGFMFEEKSEGQSAIELMVGEESGTHQTHTIFNPQKVFFEESEDNSGGAAVEIEDESGAKTIVYLAQPISVLVEYEETQIVARA